MNKIKLYFFEETFGLGGIETFILNVLKNINLDKYEVNIMTINKTTNAFDHELNKLGVCVEELVDQKISNPIKRLIKGSIAFKRRINNCQMDFIHFHVSNAIDMIYVKIAQKKKVKVRIAHSHNSSVNKLYKKIGHILLKPFVCNSATYNIACSKKAAEWLYSKKVINKGSFDIVNNAIYAKDYIYNKDIRRNYRKKLNMENNFIIGHIGRFNEQKNHDFIIKIFNEVSKNNDNARLLLIGEGHLKKQIQEKVKKLGLDSKVYFYGRCNEVNNLLQAMDLMILPSFYEGLPIVSIESQAASLMSIISDTISDETDITKFVIHLPIYDGTKVWCEKIMEFAKGYDRYNTYDSICKANYDISSLGSTIEKIYSKCYSR